MTELARHGSTDLRSLAHEANRLHASAEGHVSDALYDARDCGRILAEAKGQVNHGEWMDWVAENFDGSHRTANGYMRIADRWGELETNSQALANLGIEGALRFLAEPRENGDDTEEEPSSEAPTDPPTKPEPTTDTDPEPTPAPWEGVEPDDPPKSKADALRAQREATAGESRPAFLEEAETRAEATEPADVAEDGTKLPPSRPRRRTLSQNLRDLLDAATRLGEPDTGEIEAIDANDLMLGQLRQTRDIIDQILAHHS